MFAWTIEWMESPMSWAWLIILAAGVLFVAARVRSNKRPMQAKLWRIWARRTLCVGTFFLLLTMTPVFAMLCVMDVEEAFPPREAESLPNAEAILIPDDGFVDDFNLSLLTVQQAVHLYRAGKAKKILIFGTGGADKTKGILAEMGVPDDAISVMSPQSAEFSASKPSFIIVSHVWQMPRAVKFVAKGIVFDKITPFAFGHIVMGKRVNDMHLWDFIPSAEGAYLTSMAARNCFKYK